MTDLFFYLTEQERLDAIATCERIEALSNKLENDLKGLVEAIEGLRSPVATGPSERTELSQ